MRKSILLISLFFGALGAQAYNLDTAASYIYSSDHNQAQLSVSVPLGLNAAVGLSGKYVEDKMSVEQGGLKHPVYSVYVPIRLDFNLLSLHLTPFYYFKNNAAQPQLQDMYAYGITSKFVMNLVNDDINERYTQAYAVVAYARQKANLLEKTQWESENYDQFAFTLGVRENFFHAFSFQVAASVFQYPDGISRVAGFQGILDMKDLAFSESFDVNRSLGKYILSARLTRSWLEKHSSLYAGYHYAESHTAMPEHSVLLGNTFYVTPNAQLDIAYNHLQDVHANNKRDLGYIHLNIGF